MTTSTVSRFIALRMLRGVGEPGAVCLMMGGLALWASRARRGLMRDRGILGLRPADDIQGCVSGHGVQWTALIPFAILLCGGLPLKAQTTVTYQYTGFPIYTGSLSFACGYPWPAPGPNCPDIGPLTGLATFNVPGTFSNYSEYCGNLGANTPLTSLTMSAPALGITLTYPSAALSNVVGPVGLANCSSIAWLFDLGALPQAQMPQIQLYDFGDRVYIAAGPPDYYVLAGSTSAATAPAPGLLLG
jgi:hypothetical protein